jgi:hypothetical protein
MATKKKQAKSKTKKKAPKKKALKKLARKSAPLKKKPSKKAKNSTKAKKKTAPKKLVAKTRLAGKKKAASKKARAPKKQAAAKGPIEDTAGFTREGLRARSGGQSGDLQGLSNRAGADSESVDELLEEGNSFEADIVKGVEDAGDEGEVHTHEVPEDDVPGEYLDKD